MVTVKRIKNIIASRWRWLTKRKTKPDIKPGLPEGLSFDTVDEVAKQTWGEALQGTRFSHLSGWKDAGAFRLYLQLNAGRKKSLIFKNAIYGRRDIPALDGFPLRPGPPECLIYNKKDSLLNVFIPNVYLNKEIQPGVQYHYLLEDLSNQYRGVGSFAGRQAFFKTVDVLPLLYDALNRSCTAEDKKALLQYNQTFSKLLEEYSLNSLNRYSQNSSSEQVVKVLDLWHKIASVHSREGIREMHPLSLIHGDCNPANVMIHKKNKSSIKFLDWEWAGVGYPHADFVSLFPSAGNETVTRIIRHYQHSTSLLGVDNYLTEKEHYLLFEWCRLERGINNASYVAAQLLGSKGETLGRPGWAVSFIDNALNEVLRAYGKLSCV
ncbi:phosphotransferase family protein [Alkalimarinus coralli]|uniref:phosphotransferase family protein n=1 Tax=Alkalimarinus coralli TaxID=2935863 RepID=UPI00202B285E|nr:aminoglycoside phosphotransferase family protein [Alkalimarinus coralli]